MSAAVRHCSRKLGRQLKESTVRSIMTSYKKEVQEKRKRDDEGEVTLLPKKKRGRSKLLGEALDAKVQAYLRKIRENGGIVSARIVMAAARGLLLAYDRNQLAEFGGPVVLNRHWAYSLLQRMNYVKRKASTSKSKYTVSDFQELKRVRLLIL